MPGHESQLWIGVDCGIKSDNAAVMSVLVDGEANKLALGPFRIWKPSKREPLDIEKTIGFYLRWLYKYYRVFGIWCDPYQLHQLVTNLKNDGIPIEEFPQPPT